MGKPTPIQFEGETSMGVEHAATYLTSIYGDYMQVPPKDPQIPHNFYYMNLNEPYREYIKNRKNN